MIITIFSGYNQRAVLTFIRTLYKHSIDFAIIASSSKDDIFLTKYANKVYAIRNCKELDINDITKCIAQVKQQKNNSELLIAPSTEALNRFLLENRSYFKELNCKIPLVNKNLYEQISDKQKFYEICAKSNIKVPPLVDFDIKNIPFVCKPKSYQTKNKQIFSPLLIFNINDFNGFKNNNSDFFYQKYIEGESYYLLYYFYSNGKLAKFSQQNLIQQKNGKSIVAAIPSDIHHQSISLEFEKLFLKLGYKGLVMVELRKWGESYYMIEANPRFWGPAQLFFDCGINFFEHFLVDNGIKINIFENIKPAKYFWYGGFDYTNVELTQEKFNFTDFFKYEIYNRDDSIKIFQKETLDNLINDYSNISKHSNYQILADNIKRYLPEDKLIINSRYEKQRLDFILQNVNISNKKILDIGANTGYFTFEFLNRGANNITAYEGNKPHAQFIKRASLRLGLEKQIDVHNQYFQFDKSSENYDIILLLNILHHIGDDFGDKKLNIKHAKKKIIKDLNNLAFRTKKLVFQLGFNWKGNRYICLFPNGEKQEMIDYITDGVRDYWEIIKIGIAEKENSTIKYKELNSSNIQREDSLGEFLNRPIFIMESKCK